MQGNDSQRAQDALVGVCTSPDVGVPVTLALTMVPGVAWAGEFQDYLDAGQSPRLPAALTSAARSVALVDCDRDSGRALQTMETLQLLLPGVRVVGLGSVADTDFLLRAMRAGCNEFLTKPLQADDLAAALRRFQNEHAIASAPNITGGTVIALVGVKGGIGTTSIAVHMATHLVKTQKKKVVLIDQKHQLGHVGLYLGLKETTYCLADLLQSADRMDGDLLQGFMTRHASGVDVIPSPATCSPAMQMASEDLVQVLAALRQAYDFVLIDSAAHDQGWMAAMAPLVDQIRFVCTQDVASLRDLGRHIDHVRVVDSATEKMGIVLNRFSSDEVLSGEQITAAVRIPVVARIPNSYAEVLKAINAGEPVQPQSHSAFSNAIGRWAAAVAAASVSADSPAPVPRRRFRLWG